jgi:hypothetical protein
MHTYLALTETGVFGLVLVGIIVVATIGSVWFALSRGSKGEQRPVVSLQRILAFRARGRPSLPCDFFVVRITGAVGNDAVKEALDRAGYAYPKDRLGAWIANNAELLPRDATTQFELEPATSTSKARVVQFQTYYAGHDVRGQVKITYDIRETDVLASGDRVYHLVVRKSDVEDTVEHVVQSRLLPARSA